MSKVLNIIAGLAAGLVGLLWCTAGIALLYVGCSAFTSLSSVQSLLSLVQWIGVLLVLAALAQLLWACGVSLIDWVRRTGPWPEPGVPARTLARHIILIARRNRTVENMETAAEPLRRQFGRDLDAEWLKVRLFAAETAIGLCCPRSMRMPVGRAFHLELLGATGIAADVYLDAFRELVWSRNEGDRPLEDRVGDLFSWNLQGGWTDELCAFGRQAFYAGLADTRAYIETACRSASGSPAAAAAAG